MARRVIATTPVADDQVLFFAPTARLQVFLGRELIADPNLAVIELVKNGFDAGASDVYVDLALDGRNALDQVLTITDNGTGMTFEEFRANWMRPGYSAKVGRDSADPEAPDDTPEGRVRGRIPAGEKGLGRLATGRLGDLLTIYTRRSARHQWLRVPIDWRAFDTMDRDLTDVEIPYALTDTPPDDARIRRGTIVRIERLTLDWRSKVPGRKVPGRPDTRLGRLRQDLAMLVKPWAGGAGSFRIHLGADVQLPPGLAGIIEPHVPKDFGFLYEFAVRDDGAGDAVISRRFVRGVELQGSTGEEVIAEETIPRRDLEPSQLEVRPESFRSGEFQGRFLYYPESGSLVLSSDLPPGVYVYRDGLRIDPYGRDDWIGARERKASRQGHAGIQPRHLLGFLEITKKSNPHLIDMSNRQGLVVNEAYEDFVAYARAEFLHFESLLLKHYVEPERWAPEATTQREAQEQVRFTVSAMGTLAHNLRPPVSALAMTLTTLYRTVGKASLPDDIRQRVDSLYERSQEHLSRLEAAIDSIFELPTAFRPETVELSDVVDDAVHRVKQAPRSQVQVVGGPTAVVETDRHLAAEVITGLLRNALEAPRAGGRPAHVWISWATDDGGASITVADDGEGVPGEIRTGLFVSVRSTKGRPGTGLFYARMLARAMQGDLVLEPDDGKTTRFKLTIPLRQRRRRRR